MKHGVATDSVENVFGSITSLYGEFYSSLHGILYVNANYFYSGIKII